MTSIVLYFLLLVIWCILFAKLEIEIEGENGWAAKAPTARYKLENNQLFKRPFNSHEWSNIDHTQWPGKFYAFYIKNLLGGKDFTGYHRVVDLIQLFVGHLITYAVFYGYHSIWILEIRALAFLFLVWSIEDTLFFILNPVFGWRRLTQADVSWHKNFVKIGKLNIQDKGMIILFLQGFGLMIITFFYPFI